MENKVLKGLLITLGLTFLATQATAQISEQEARAVDSLVVYSGYFQAPTLHDTITLAGDNGNTYNIFCFGGGLYTPIDDYSIAWTGTEHATPGQEEEFDAQNGQAFKRFDLNDYNDSFAYRQALTDWLHSVGVPISLREIHFKELQIKIFPNPTTGKVNIKLSDSQNNVHLKIFNAKGLLINAYTLDTNTQIDFKTLPPGIYILRFECNGLNHVEKVVVRQTAPS